MLEKYKQGVEHEKYKHKVGVPLNEGLCTRHIGTDLLLYTHYLMKEGKPSNSRKENTGKAGVVWENHRAKKNSNRRDTGSEYEAVEWIPFNPLGTYYVFNDHRRCREGEYKSYIGRRQLRP